MVRRRPEPADRARRRVRAGYAGLARRHRLALAAPTCHALRNHLAAAALGVFGSATNARSRIRTTHPCYLIILLLVCALALVARASPRGEPMRAGVAGCARLRQLLVRQRHRCTAGDAARARVAPRAVARVAAGRCRTRTDAGALPLAAANAGGHGHIALRPAQPGRPAAAGCARRSSMCSGLCSTPTSRRCCPLGPCARSPSPARRWTNMFGDIERTTGRRPASGLLVSSRSA